VIRRAGSIVTLRVRFSTRALELVWLGEPEARVFRMSS